MKTLCAKVVVPGPQNHVLLTIFIYIKKQRLQSNFREACIELNKNLKSLFDRFWLAKICCEKLGIDGLDHNKSRFYRTLKSSFTQEPYILDIPNRSQQAWLTRYQVSAVPNLGIESGRYTRPVTPVTSRLCKYCSSNSIDDENHAVLECNTFLLKRNCFFGRITSLLPNFKQMSPKHKLLFSLVPT